jgi:hypothetical protein
MEQLENCSQHGRRFSKITIIVVGVIIIDSYPAHAALLST